ncbi:MAG: S9 family peptidase [Idiomarina sp.]
MNLLKTVVPALLVVAMGGMNPALATTDKPHLAPEDIFELEHANNVQISPDGKYVVYVRSSFDVMADNTSRSLWLIDVATGKHTPLFADQHSYGNPSWAPDSNRLAFTSNRQGRNQIHVHWLQEQRTAQITEVQQSPSQLSWSPNGEHLAFMMSEPAAATDFARSVYQPKKPKDAKWGATPIVVERTYYQRDGRGVMASEYSQIFVVPASGGSARQLTEGPYNHNGPLTWLPDNNTLVFSANRNENWEYQGSESNLWQLNLASEELTQLTDIPGAEYSATLSPNGRKLAFLHRSNEPVAYKNTKLHVMDWQSKQTTALLADFDRSVESPSWLNNTKLAFQYADKGRNKVAEVDLNSRRSDLVNDLGGVYVSRPYLSGMYSASAGTGAIAYTRGTEYRLADVAVFDSSKTKGKQKQVFTQLNEDVLGQRKLGEVHEINYESSFDGTEIQGWYITPPDYDPSKKYPLIVEIHGGPHLAYGPFFAAEHQRYAAEGYVVFYNNYRGSTSYGEDFALLLDGFYSSERDFADHMSGIDVLIEKGVADADNLYIAGGSAGGIATAYAVGLTDRFNAAAATNPVINWVSKTLTADSSMGQIANQFPGMPWEELDHYWKRSPLSVVGNVKTPTLLFTGEKDRRTPISETEQFYQALQLLQVDTAMVRVPDAYHGVTAKPSRVIAKIEHTLAWFAQYRK